MNSLLLLVPLSLVLVVAAGWAFAWAVRRGQFDDLDTPPVRMLHDETASRARDRVRADGSRE
jgi:cbb3-type cytochrome oxidase maturation protein